MGETFRALYTPSCWLCRAVSGCLDAKVVSVFGCTGFGTIFGSENGRGVFSFVFEWRCVTGLLCRYLNMLEDATRLMVRDLFFQLVVSHFQRELQGISVESLRKELEDLLERQICDQLSGSQIIASDECGEIVEKIFRIALEDWTTLFVQSVID